MLIGKDRGTTQELIRMLDDYLRHLGMGLSIGKCSTFEIKTAQKTWYMKDPELKIHGEAISCCGPEEVVTYLGAKLTRWKGMIRGVNTAPIVKTISNIR